MLAVYQALQSDKRSVIMSEMSETGNPSWKFSFLEQSHTAQSYLDQMRYHDERMGQRLGTLLLDLGTSASGSRALGESFEDLMLNSIEAIANQTADILNEQVIRPIIEMNFPSETAMVKVANLTALNIHKAVEAWTKLAGRFDVRLTRADQDIIRDGLHLAPAPEDAMDLDPRPEGACPGRRPPPIRTPGRCACVDGLAPAHGPGRWLAPLRSLRTPTTATTTARPARLGVSPPAP